MRSSLSHQAARIALATLFSLLLAGCESSIPEMNTAAPDRPGFAKVVAHVSEPLAGSTTLGGPLADLTADELTRFADGQEEFEDVEDVEDGLGPVFNEASCAVCHDAPVGGTTGRSETRFGRMVGGVFDGLANLGGSLIQDHAIGAVPDGNGG
jgi:CxxC motif-containing protein (DUF1111 family)